MNANKVGFPADKADEQSWFLTLTRLGSAPDTDPPKEDTTPPVITVPEDITEEATSPDGATVSFEVSAHDDEDGPVDVDCDHNSGDTFPIGETVVTCNMHKTWQATEQMKNHLQSQ